MLQTNLDVPLLDEHDALTGRVIPTVVSYLVDDRRSILRVMDVDIAPEHIATMNSDQVEKILTTAHAMMQHQFRQCPNG